MRKINTNRVISVVVVTAAVAFLLHSMSIILGTPQWLPQSVQRHIFRAGRGSVLKDLIEVSSFEIIDVHNFGGIFGGGYCSAQCQIVATDDPLATIRQACATAGWSEKTGQIGPDEGGWYRTFSASGERLPGNTNDLVFLRGTATKFVRDTPVLVVRYPFKHDEVLFYVSMWR